MNKRTVGKGRRHFRREGKQLSPTLAPRDKKKWIINNQLLKNPFWGTQKESQGCFCFVF